MYKSVDTENDILNGFKYTNKDGEEEFVTIQQEDFVVALEAAGSDPVNIIYVEDIPKLIKALQAAYDHVNKEK